MGLFVHPSAVLHSNNPHCAQAHTVAAESLQRPQYKQVMKSLLCAAGPLAGKFSSQLCFEYTLAPRHGVTLSQTGSEGLTLLQKDAAMGSLACRVCDCE